MNIIEDVVDISTIKLVSGYILGSQEVEKLSEVIEVDNKEDFTYNRAVVLSGTVTSDYKGPAIDVGDVIIFEQLKVIGLQLEGKKPERMLIALKEENIIGVIKNNNGEGK